MGYEVVLSDGSVAWIEGAGAYRQEGPLTTFFRTDDGGRIDAWSTRLASFRTGAIDRVRIVEEPDAAWSQPRLAG